VLPPLLFMLALPLLDVPGAPVIVPTDAAAVEPDERHPHFAPPTRPASKKAAWLRDKAFRVDVHVTVAPPAPGKAKAKPPQGAPLDTMARLVDGTPGRPGRRALPVTTLFNQWTHEAYPVLPGHAHQRRFQVFLRDHFTGRPTRVDGRLFYVLLASAHRFKAAKVEVISGYRAPKYNLMLRKKGRQVARESQHTLGTAVDFRLRGVPVAPLRDFVRSLRLGGVGFYPRTQFVHADTGRIRFWTGS
jgi:hypothetical protein